MKRFIFALLLMSTVVAGASAQSWKDLLGKVVGEVASEVSSSSEAGGAVVNILGAILGNSLTLSDEALEGTWNYEGVACVLESEDALSNIGGTLVTGTLEAKLDEMLTKVGISQGNCTFTFVQDGTCTINVKGYDIKGKYELDANEKVIVFTFMYDKLPLKTYVAYEVQNLNIVFKADRVLSFIKSVASYVSKGASGEQAGQLQSVMQAVGAMGTLLQNYDGMMLGAKMTKASAASGNSSASANTGSTSAGSGDTADKATGSSLGNKLSNGLGKLFK